VTDRVRTARASVKRESPVAVLNAKKAALGAHFFGALLSVRRLTRLRALAAGGLRARLALGGAGCAGFGRTAASPNAIPIEML